MSYREQKIYFEKLKRYERKFKGKEAGEYRILVQRHKDEEELDKLSLARLKDLYDKYYVNRPKPNLDDLFKK
ncbi:MAG: hypothetical protein SCALA702_11600 [Melioribacteraceae bacterium]|nr:MAG: hypothetical protein SCALA702_11600 [Melioribacteraceae bacterium]